jgi:hypothetical protein
MKWDYPRVKAIKRGSRDPGIHAEEETVIQRCRQAGRRVDKEA